MDLTTYDWIVINSSAGKDSQAMLDYVVELADQQAVPRDRLVVVHCDLGRVEWQGTRALAERQATHYGLRFEVVQRDRDLLHQIEHERKKFPGPGLGRFCTSDQKTKQVQKLWTRLARESRQAGVTRQVRILDCLGLRAEESPDRAKKPAFRTRSTNGRRVVDGWLPIHGWTTRQVWDRIRASGVEHHPIYDQGLPRLSCSFCIFAPKHQLVRAAQLRPDLAAEYARIEQTIGHRFTDKLSMADVIAAAQATPAPADDQAAA